MTVIITIEEIEGNKLDDRARKTTYVYPNAQLLADDVIGLLQQFLHLSASDELVRNRLENITNFANFMVARKETVRG